MRRGLLLVVGLASICATLPQPAKADPRGLPGAVLGLISRPIGAVIGTVHRIARPPAHVGRVHVQPSRSHRSAVASQSRPSAAAARRAAKRAPLIAAAPLAPVAAAMLARPERFNAAEAPARAGTLATGAETIETTGSASTTGSGAASRAIPSAEPVPTPPPRPQIAALSPPANDVQGRDATPAAAREPMRDASAFGRVGPSSWPSAYEDVIGFMLWPQQYGESLRIHGVRDVLSTIFAPGARAQTARVADNAPTAGAPASCSSIDQVDANWPTAQIERSIQLTSEQRVALDRLRAAIGEAIMAIKATCRDQAGASPVERIGALQSMLWAVRDAAILIRAPLTQFIESLTDEQKKQFVLPTQASDPRAADARRIGREAMARMCGMPKPVEWPARQIEQDLRPNEAQRASLQGLQKRSFEMGQFLMASCLQPVPSTPTARLDMAADRLTAVVFAASNISLALNDFYSQLGERQKERFNSFGL